MKTAYVNPKTQCLNIIPLTGQMQSTSPFANPQGEGGTPVIGPLS